MKRLPLFLVVFILFLTPSLIFGDEGKCIEGDCVNGYGTMIHSHKKYVGYFKDGFEEGHGKFTTPMGEIFEGDPVGGSW